MGNNFTDIAVTDPVTAATINDRLDELDAAIGRVLDTGTSFPASPTAGDRFWRTDLGTLYVYDGSSWQPIRAGQCHFNAYAGALIANVTGDGTSYSVVFGTELEDVGGDYNHTTGVFTAPIDGEYFFNANVLLSGLTSAHTFGHLSIITTSASFRGAYQNPYSMAYTGYVTLNTIARCRMTAGQTASVSVYVANGTKVVNVFASGAIVYSYFQGGLI